VFGVCKKQKSDAFGIVMTGSKTLKTVMVIVGEEEFVKTKIITELKIIVLVSTFITLVIQSIHNILLTLCSTLMVHIHAI
jgi:hypothetical protein